MATFDDNDVTFEYPDNWELSIEGNAGERTVFLQSPDSAFWLLTMFDEQVSSIHVIENAETALTSEYEDCDVEPFESEILGFEADCRTIDFSCLDLIGRARMQAFTTHRRTFFVMSQRADVDAETADEVFAAITASLRLPTE